MLAHICATSGKAVNCLSCRQLGSICAVTSLHKSCFLNPSLYIHSREMCLSIANVYEIHTERSTTSQNCGPRQLHIQSYVGTQT